jgi:hypothetical protein
VLLDRLGTREAKFETQLLVGFSPDYDLSIGPAHQLWSLRVVCSVDHVIHDLVASSALENRPRRGRLVTELIFKSSDETVWGVIWIASDKPTSRYLS